MFRFAVSLLVLLWTAVSALQLGNFRYRRIFQRNYRVLDDPNDYVNAKRSNKRLKLPSFRKKLRKASATLPNTTSTTGRSSQDPVSVPPSQAATEPSSLSRQSSKKQSPPVRTAYELREQVLDHNVALRDITLNSPSYTAATSVATLLNHSVVQLLAARHRTQSTPGNRHDDHRLALSLEGGGMRGAVSAGMAAAIACLGLVDAFDAVYGSSAGSVIGAYMISRQMCLDVYVDILTTAKKTFVCVNRMLSALAVNAVDLALSSMQATIVKKLGHDTLPGMNISFVLDGIMHHQDGIRPLDMQRFRENDRKQPLRVASSYVQNGTLKIKCFGTEHFFDNDEQQTLAVQRADCLRQGLYACLEASMTVPGATGPPVVISDANSTFPFFDAFCFEPLPYRSAVEEGATHVLVLCSRPEGFQPQTKPGVYERAIAPLYFRSHAQLEVARFFERGGQQYIYAEDLLTLQEGKISTNKTVKVPPAEILYGVDRDLETQRLATHREEWNEAHLLPLQVPMGTPELHTLEQDRDAVLEAVRGGFATAFDLLAPAIGLELDSYLTGKRVAKLVFPRAFIGEMVLQNQVRVAGDAITNEEATSEKRKKRYFLRQILRKVRVLRRQQDDEIAAGSDEVVLDSQWQAEQLLRTLPGLQAGKMKHLVKSLYEWV